MTQPLTQAKFQQKIYDRTDGEVKCIEQYKGSRKTHCFRHIPCGSPFHATPDNLYRHKYNCPKCRRAGYNCHSANGRINTLVDVRCKHMHRFMIQHSNLTAFHQGKIECPICQRLAVLDPLYKGAIVDFSFEHRLGL